ncbi:hypothetical protein PtA15_1A544 [Puccinia triticina]|uniref:Uncharacterized protein n=1 Tax=Puccinia triticina TaxID=208348 RepID=A0ABY7C941_9BASI|nr:uncharacterized protein PtA15_1A544 [Puccinia triticina]WAQ81204.1 hypothetical protein PtA15_1A544 [Puccinia triticina]
MLKISGELLVMGYEKVGRGQAKLEEDGSLGPNLEVLDLLDSQGEFLLLELL